VQGDEIFIREGGVACLRRPLRSHVPRSWNSVKWLSPEEAGRGAGPPEHLLWPALSFRLGLLIFCLGAGMGSDPYPHRSPDAVLNDLVRESQGLGEPLRPDLHTFQGPDLLRQLVAASFRLGGQCPPTRGMFGAVLASLSSGGMHRHDA
jgi:hypothetical protein